MASFAPHVLLILSQGLKAQASLLGILLPPAHWDDRCCLLHSSLVSLFLSLCLLRSVSHGELQLAVRFPCRKLLLSLPKAPLHLAVLLLSLALSLCMFPFGTGLGKASLTATLAFVVGLETVISCC